MIYGVYGASGFGREVMPLAKSQLERNETKDYQLVFIDDNEKQHQINGYDVISFNDFLQVKKTKKFISVAIADGAVRKKISEKISNQNIELWDICAENVVILDGVARGRGSILTPFVTITSNVQIGKSFQANIYSYVAHDCKIGDYVTFAPGVKCNGNVIIKSGSYLGTGAIIRQGKPDRPIVIGENAVVAMGAVVTKSVPDGVTVLGNPAKKLTKDSLRN